jgi:hypothetical protein
MKPRVYVAGPYSSGDPQTNTDLAIDVGDAIADLGADPFIPHLSHYREARHARPYTFWIEEDLRWLRVCDALYRMDGASKGADGEVAEAHRLGIPVFYSLDELKAWIENRD